VLPDAAYRAPSIAREWLVAHAKADAQLQDPPIVVWFADDLRQ